MTDASMTGPGAGGRHAGDGGHTGHPAPQRGHVSLVALWFGIFAAPVAWSVQTLVNFPVAAHGCFPQLEPLTDPRTAVRGIAFAVSIIVLAIGAAALAVSFRAWMRTRGEHHDASGEGRDHTAQTAALETGEGRTRFMALSGVLTSIVFLLLSLVHVASLFLVGPCGS